MPPHYKSHYWLSLQDQYCEKLRGAAAKLPYRVLRNNVTHTGKQGNHYISLKFAPMEEAYDSCLSRKNKNGRVG